MVRAALAHTNDRYGGKSGILVVHGGAVGVDTIARDFALEQGWPEPEQHLAAWNAHTTECPQAKAHFIRRYCSYAGHRRNQEMVDAGAHVCVAFIYNDSRGASDCARRAELAGIETHYFRITIES